MFPRQEKVDSAVRGVHHHVSYIYKAVFRHALLTLFTARSSCAHPKLWACVMIEYTT